jgi:peptidoglycan/xylan/chitin deacetylase (PgdA/CDA1 family)
MTNGKFQNYTLDKPVFSLSLDIELAWAFILNSQQRALNRLRNDPGNGRGAIVSLLKLLEKYDVPATWAVVGNLFLGLAGAGELIQREMPQFTEGWLDWDFYSSLHGNALYFGRDIVEKVLASPVKHEIGLHSFFHIPFSLCSQEVARAEVELGIKAAEMFGLSPRSFVFPQNRIGHTDVLKEYGFTIYRSKNRGQSRRWEHKFIIRKYNGLLGQFVTLPVSPSYKDGIWELPSSMCFSGNPLLNLGYLSRTKFWLNQAIRSNRVFHIWLHPWSLSVDKGLTNELENFLALVAQRRDKGKLEVMTMGQLAAYLESGE